MLFLRRLTAISVAIAALFALACSSESAHAPAAASGAAPQVATRMRVALAQIGHDTLSDSARVTAIVAQPDGGDALSFRFDDPGRQVVAGLGIVRGVNVPQLLWPDSVTDTWWSAPYTLAFTTATGRGVEVVVDVRSATLDVVRQAPSQVAPAPPAPRADTASLRRATAFVDSALGAPHAAGAMGGTGTGAGGALTYHVVTVHAAPAGRLRMFYVVATDSGGRRLNPAWYVLDTASRGVARVDRIVGPADEMPESAGAWSDSTRFLYARGREIWEATVAPAPLRAHP